jgi:hypothetical protein
MNIKGNPKPGTVIDEDEYQDELREVGRLLRRPRDARPDPRLSAALDLPVERVRHPIPKGATTGPRGGRIAVVAGQLLVWHLHGVPVPRPSHAARTDEPFPDLFGLYWSLLKRRLQLDVRSAVDLVRIDRAGRGDTEPRHALVALLERNFAPPAPGPLCDELRAWGDELAVDRDARIRKLATRVFRLAGGSGTGISPGAGE